MLTVVDIQYNSDEYRYNTVQFFTKLPTAPRYSDRLYIDFKITTDTPYLALTGELWSVCCKDIGENWPRYNGTALYCAIQLFML